MPRYKEYREPASRPGHTRKKRGQPWQKESLRHLGGVVEGLRIAVAWLNAKSIVYRAVCIGGLALCVATYGIFSAVFMGNAYGVYVDGQQIAIVKDETEAKKVLDELVDVRSDEFGGTLSVEEKISFKGVRAQPEEFTDYSELKKSLNQTLSFSVVATALVVDGDVKVVLKSRADAEELLEWLKSYYPIEPDEQLEFKEKIELIETVVDQNDLMSDEDIRNIMLYGSNKLEIYEVVEGDTAWDIALANGMYVDELAKSNPGVDTWILSIGQKLVLNKEAPTITVVSTRLFTTDEEIPYQVEETIDDKLMPGEKRIVIPGEPGLRTVTYFVTRENGFEMDREIIEADIVREPSTEVVRRGSQLLMASNGGGGRMSWPCSGKLVSNFGMRWGRMHNGIDLAANTGESVRSVASGKVIHAAYGYSGGYGNNIEVSHGSGIVTKYAHLSSINVNVGQTVERGELIGRVGNTGYSTGPHLHFEVRVSGSAHNPLIYLE